MREGLINSNPAALVKLPAGKPPRPLIWTEPRVEQWQSAVERLTAADADDPLRDVLEAAAQPPSPVMVWHPDQAGAFLDAAHGHPLYAAFHVVAHVGLRRGEVCAL